MARERVSFFNNSEEGKRAGKRCPPDPGQKVRGLMGDEVNLALSLQ